MDWRNEFQLDSSIAYLNHAAIAPWPKRTGDAVRAFSDEVVLQGSLNYGKWLEAESDLREQLRCLINARSADEIALLKSTSEGLSVVAHGLPWLPGDNVVIPSIEFPSNRIVWESLAERGVEVRIARIDSLDSPETVITDQIDARTRLVSVSSVQYASGLRLDLPMLGRFCEEHEVLFCVDAIQSLGALPFDTRKARADFVVADGHKWMLGPEGVALFYCRKELAPRLRLHQYGWHMVEHAGEFERKEWEPAHTARRFECGSPNMLGIHALQASLSLVHEVGLDHIEANISRNIRYLSENIEKMRDYQILSPQQGNRQSGILTVAPMRESLEAVFRRLQRAGVVCAVRGGGIRFSPHFYTPRRALDRALGEL